VLLGENIKYRGAVFRYSRYASPYFAIQNLSCATIEGYSKHNCNAPDMITTGLLSIKPIPIIIVHVKTCCGCRLILYMPFVTGVSGLVVAYVYSAKQMQAKEIEYNARPAANVSPPTIGKKQDNSMVRLSMRA